MSSAWGTRIQAALAMALFLGSLGTLLYNSYAATTLPQHELQARTSLQAASRLLADAAESVLPKSPARSPQQLDDLHAALLPVTNRVLATFSGVEGGFYLRDADRFAGYGFPTADGHHPVDVRRTDPPPLETPLIRVQALQSLSEQTPLFSVRDVGPSRVMVVTQAVGTARPAPAVTWAMLRLTGPEQLGGQLRRYQVSVGLALAGFLCSLALAFTLTRSLAGQRTAQEQLREELRRSEQLASLGKLLAGLAHEIRNPLAGIRSTVQLWQRMRDPAKMTGSLEAVVEATARLDEILTRLLHFARTEHAERRPLQVNDLVVETFRLLDAHAQDQHVVLESDLAPTLPPVTGSPSSLRQVLLNLATNALQAMPSGGTLRCRTRHDKPAGMVEVTIADTGSGVSQSDRQHLFEPFFTTRPEGTGLGLALCREILTQHGGLIELMTRQEPGATFRILLPVRER